MTHSNLCLLCLTTSKTLNDAVVHAVQGMSSYKKSNKELSFSSSDASALALIFGNCIHDSKILLKNNVNSHFEANNLNGKRAKDLIVDKPFETDDMAFDLRPRPMIHVDIPVLGTGVAIYASTIKGQRGLPNNTVSVSKTDRTISVNTNKRMSTIGLTDSDGNEGFVYDDISLKISIDRMAIDIIDNIKKELSDEELKDTEIVNNGKNADSEPTAKYDKLTYMSVIYNYILHNCSNVDTIKIDNIEFFQKLCKNTNLNDLSSVVTKMEEIINNAGSRKKDDWKFVNAINLTAIEFVRNKNFRFTTQRSYIEFENDSAQKISRPNIQIFEMSVKELEEKLSYIKPENVYDGLAKFIISQKQYPENEHYYNYIKTVLYNHPDAEKIFELVKTHITKSVNIKHFSSEDVFKNRLLVKSHNVFMEIKKELLKMLGNDFKEKCIPLEVFQQLNDFALNFEANENNNKKLLLIAENFNNKITSDKLGLYPNEIIDSLNTNYELYPVAIENAKDLITKFNNLKKLNNLTDSDLEACFELENSLEEITYDFNSLGSDLKDTIIGLDKIEKKYNMCKQYVNNHLDKNTPRREEALENIALKIFKSNNPADALTKINMAISTIIQHEKESPTGGIITKENERMILCHIFESLTNNNNKHHLFDKDGNRSEFYDIITTLYPEKINTESITAIMDYCDILNKYYIGFLGMEKYEKVFNESGYIYKKINNNKILYKAFNDVLKNHKYNPNSPTTFQNMEIKQSTITTEAPFDTPTYLDLSDYILNHKDTKDFDFKPKGMVLFCNNQQFNDFLTTAIKTYKKVNNPDPKELKNTNWQRQFLKETLIDFEKVLPKLKRFSSKYFPNNSDFAYTHYINQWFEDKFSNENMTFTMLSKKIAYDYHSFTNTEKTIMLFIKKYKLKYPTDKLPLIINYDIKKQGVSKKRRIVITPETLLKLACGEDEYKDVSEKFSFENVKSFMEAALHYNYLNSSECAEKNNEFKLLIKEDQQDTSLSKKALASIATAVGLTNQHTPLEKYINQAVATTTTTAPPKPATPPAGTNNSTGNNASNQGKGIK